MIELEVPPSHRVSERARNYLTGYIIQGDKTLGNRAILAQHKYNEFHGFEMTRMQLVRMFQLSVMAAHEEIGPVALPLELRPETTQYFSEYLAG